MDLGKAALVIGIMLVIVLLLNVAIYAAVYRGDRQNEADVMRRVFNQAVHPLNNDDGTYKELSKRVAALKERHPESEKQLDEQTDDR